MNQLFWRISLLLVIYFFMPLLSTAQHLPDYHKIDSIAHELQKSKRDTNRVKLLNQLSANYLSKQELSAAEFDVVSKHLQHAIALCDSLGLSFAPWKASSLKLKGDALVLYDKVGEGEKVFMELVKNAQEAGDKKREAKGWIAFADAIWKYNKTGPFEREATVAYTNAMSIYQEIKNQKAAADMAVRIASLYIRNEALNKAEVAYLAAIKLCEMYDPHRVPFLYYCLAATNRYLGNYNKALRYALYASKKMGPAKDSINAGYYYGELAEIYQALDKPEESVNWYKKCIAAREVQKGFRTIYLYRTYSLLIIQLIKAGAPKEALSTIKSVHKRKPPISPAENAVFFQSLAYCYEAAKIYDSTEKYFLKAVAGYKKGRNDAGMDEEIISLAHYDIANFYIKHRQFARARPFLDSILLRPTSISVSIKADVQLLLFKTDSAFGNYIAAIKHLQQHKILADSILNEKKSRQIEQLQVEYETEKKDQEIGHLTKKDQLQQANLKQANIIKNWIAASSGLLVLLLAVVYNRYRLKQKTNRQLEEQQVVINQKNVSLQRLVDEKEWLMKEIHHRVKNNFHIVSGLLGTQSGYLKNEEAIAAIKESQQRIHAMSLIHQKLYQSESLSAIDMPDYIHELVDYLKDSFDKDAATRFHFDIDRIQLALSHVIPVGLILNEAITNAFKYAFPGKREGNIYILFKQAHADNTIVLTVKDDGVGLPANFNSNRQSSMGINLMRGLSQDIDGSFTMQSDHGALITVSFMYNPDLSDDFAAAGTTQNSSK